MRIGTLLAAAIFLAPLQAAHAQVDNAGAADLRDRLQSSASLSFMFSTPGSDVGLNIEEITVTPAGDSYSVAYKGYGFTDGTGGSAMLGDIELSMQPLGGGRFNVSDLSAPALYLYRSVAGDVVLEVAVSGLGVDAVYNMETSMYEEGGLFADSVELVAPSSGALVSFTNAKLYTADYDYDGERLSAATAFDLDDLSFTVTVQEESTEVMTLEHASGGVSFEGLDVAGLLQAMENFDASADALLALYSHYEGMLAVETIFQGLDVGAAGERVTADEFKLAYGGLLTSGPTTQGFLELGFSGLLIDNPEVAALADPRLIPEDGSLSVSLEQVPTAPLVEAYRMVIVAALDQSAEIPDASDKEAVASYLQQNAELEAMMEREAEAAFLEILQSGMVINLDTVQIATPAAQLVGSGIFNVNADAIHGVEGDLVAELEGAAELQAVASEMAATGDPAKVETAQGILGAVGMMMAFSQGPATPAPSTPAALSYLVQLLADGSVTVNGLPVVPPATQQ